MKKYDSYKNSGIEWIGEIPSHWEVKKIKHLTKLQGGYAFKSDLFSTEGTPVIRIGDISDNINFDDCKKIDNDTIPKEYCLDQFDTLIALSGATTGKTCFVKNIPPKAYINQRVARIMFSNKLLFYIVNSGFFQEQILLTASGSAQENISNSQIENLEISISNNPKEQIAIAAYLDRKTAEIDELIADKKRLLELYEEEKTAIINQAVTKGIHPTVKMKDSGIEWLGEVPEHWEVKRLKYVGKIKYGLGQPPKQKTDGLPIIRATNVFRGRIDEKDLIFVDPDDIPYERDPILRTDDIIVVRSGAYTADSAIIPSKFDGSVTGYDMVFRCNKDHYPKFVSFGFLSDYILKRQLIMHSLRAAQPHLNREELGETLIIIPPFEEQQSIVHHIETECARIATKKSKTEKQIELLTEYRTALISEVVTGKVKVIE